METGRFQPAIEQERFGGGPFGAEGLSGSFVRAAYGATSVNQNPGDARGLTEPAGTLRNPAEILRSLAKPGCKHYLKGGIL